MVEANRKFFEVLSVNSVAPLLDSGSLLMSFRSTGNDPDLVLTMPAGAIGHMVSLVAAAHQEMTLKGTDRAGSFLPLKLTHCRPFQTESADPILMLQLEGVFELALLTNARGRKALIEVLQGLDQPAAAPTKRH